jgi:hypothetical protein
VLLSCLEPHAKALTTRIGLSPTAAVTTKSLVTVVTTHAEPETSFVIEPKAAGVGIISAWAVCHYRVWLEISAMSLP